MDGPRRTTAASPPPPAASAPAGSHITAKKQMPLNIASLMSPPDAVPFDSFGHSTHAAPAEASTQRDKFLDARPRVPMSPPVSPHVTLASSTAQQTPSSTAKDPILYPRRDGEPPSPPQQPLFPVADELMQQRPQDSKLQRASESMNVQHSRLVNQHIEHGRDNTMFKSVLPPKREEYEIVLQFTSKVMEMWKTKDRRDWVQKERAILAQDMALNRDRWNNTRYPAIAPAKGVKLPVKVQPAKRTPAAKPDRVTKPAQVRPLSSSSSPSSAAAAAAPRAPRASQASAKNRLSSTPEPGRRVVAPNREDRDFNALEDLCPPLNSLPNKPNSLKVEWKGAPVDLSTDPHAHLLHPDELSLAANLRLDCATYLTSKRRIFIRRRECAKTGKEFRKTDAQQACRIDVNKASKLWTAFEKVGWLDRRWMEGRY